MTDSENGTIDSGAGQKGKKGQIPPRWMGWLDRPGVSLLIVMGAAVLLLLPFLGRSGLWDPQEVRLVDQAKDAAAGSLVEAARKGTHPPLPMLAIAYSLRHLGTSEWAARLPVALTGLLALLALFLTALWLGRRRAAPLAVLVLLGTPVFFLGARQATPHLFAVLGHILAVGGLAALSWPRPPVGDPSGSRLGERLLGLLAAVAGLTIGYLSLGADLGIAAPAFAVATALCLASPGGHEAEVALLSVLGTAGLLVPLRLLISLAATQGSAPLLTDGRRLSVAVGLIGLGGIFLAVGAIRRWRSSPLLGTAMFLCGVALLVHLPKYAGSYSPFVGSYLHLPPNREAQVDTVLRPLGFQLFPWAALLPLALSALVRFPMPAKPDDEALGSLGRAGREAAARAIFAQLVPLSWFALTYVLCTYHSAIASDVPFPALGALALCSGFYLDRLFASPSGDDAGGVTGGLCAGLLAVLLGRDLFLFPEQYGGAHLSEALHWPAPLTTIPSLLVALSMVFGLLLFAGMATRGRLRRGLLTGVVGVSLLAAGWGAYAMVPAISQHVSYRGIYTKYKQLGGGALGTYGISRAGSKFYGQSSVELTSIAGVFDFLYKDPGKRSFAMVGSQELGPLDQHSRQHGRAYHVVDDSNVQFLLVSNRLGPNEADLNPLLRLVLDKEPKPQHEAHANFDGRIQLIGYDAPAEVSRGQDLTIRLYYKVLQPVGAGYRVFLHFDGAGTRWNGDHVPLDGKFPSSYWATGTYIIDEHKMTTSRVGQPAGSYQMLTGFWPGGDGARLKVIDGPQDGENRVKLGILRVK